MISIINAVIPEPRRESVDPFDMLYGQIHKDHLEPLRDKRETFIYTVSQVNITLKKIINDESAQASSILISPSISNQAARAYEATSEYAKQLREHVVPLLRGSTPIFVESMPSFVWKVYGLPGSNIVQGEEKERAEQEVVFDLIKDGIWLEDIMLEHVMSCCAYYISHNTMPPIPPPPTGSTTWVVTAARHLKEVKRKIDEEYMMDVSIYSALRRNMQVPVVIPKDLSGFWCALRIKAMSSIPTLCAKIKQANSEIAKVTAELTKMKDDYVILTEHDPRIGQWIEVIGKTGEITPVVRVYATISRLYRECSDKYKELYTKLQDSPQGCQCHRSVAATTEDGAILEHLPDCNTELSEVIYNIAYEGSQCKFAAWFYMSMAVFKIYEMPRTFIDAASRLEAPPRALGLCRLCIPDASKSGITLPRRTLSTAALKLQQAIVTCTGGFTEPKACTVARLKELQLL